MQKLKVLSLAVIVAYSLCISVLGRDIFAMKTALTTTQSTNASFSISVVAGEVLEFGTRDLERRLSLEEGTLGGITVTSLPDISQGALFLDGVEVEVYEFVDREALDRLCFVPGDNAPSATVTFLPQSKDAVTTNLSIQVVAQPGSPPEIEDGVCETIANVAVTGTVNARDPDGGPVTLALITKPQKGSVTFDGLQYTYKPYKDMTGSDSFVVCAVDELSDYSREATVSIHIEKASYTFTYTDMTTNPSSYAAIKLREAGILMGEQIGTIHLFQPDDQVTRGEYAVMLLAAAGLEHTAVPTVNTGLPNDTQLPSWLKPYAKAAIEAGIISGEQPFNYLEIPSRAEAVLMCDMAAEITDVKDFDLNIPDENDIPQWALASYKDLAAYKMLDLHTGYAKPDGELTRSYAADLIWQLYKHRHR